MGPIVEARPKPTPRARLTMKEMPGQAFEMGFNRFWSRKEPEPERIPVLDLVFDYGGARFSPDDPRANASRYDGTCVHRVHRNPAFEARSLKRLSHLGLQPLSTDWRYGRGDRRSGVMWMEE